jgi:hypothetical protein
MLSVHIQKDISEYKPKLVGSLTARRLISIAAALGLPVLTGVYLVFVLGLDVNAFMPVFMAEGIGFWAFGFIRPRGMDLEYWLPRYMTAMWGGNVLLHSTSLTTTSFGSAHDTLNDDIDRSWTQLARKTNGIERYMGAGTF